MELVKKKSELLVEYLELSNFLAICDRMSEVVERQSDKKVIKLAEIARQLGVSYKAIHNIKRAAEGKDSAKRSLPLKEIIFWCIEHGVDITWLLTGESKEDLFCGKAPSSDIAEKLRKARYVLETGDSAYTSILAQNIEAFHSELKPPEGIIRPDVRIACGRCDHVFVCSVEDVLTGEGKVSCPNCGVDFEFNTEEIQGTLVAFSKKMDSLIKQATEVDPRTSKKSK